MALDTLEVFGHEYLDVAGFKATDDNNQTKTFIRPQGTKTISENGAVDVTEYESVVVNVSGGGGSNYLVSLSNYYPPDSQWWFPNTFPDGGVFEITFDPSNPHTDYDHIIGIGNPINQWNFTTGIGIYHDTQSGNDRINIRQNAVSNFYNIDSSKLCTVKIDKNYVYLNGEAKVATNSKILPLTTLKIGCEEGSKRFTGQIVSMTYQ